MGRMIEQIALDRGHQIALRIDKNQEELFDSEAFKSADVVIEFTQPKVASRNCHLAIERGLPVVSGTTGWAKEMKELSEWVKEDEERTFFWASNFSVGVNLFFEMNRRIAQLMRGFKDYKLSMSEVHHIHKLDAPSGTAITLAENILDEYEGLSGWYSLQNNEPRAEENVLEIESIRRGE
ncbi:4-hydroxy-tetrahydrodipicolinate reductase-like, partial [Globicephala melas]|uniref:4-hydroxy-tetrahydrodipicolinate reductase-like n=1 Tax=Globicephala melas TaxID=9731 RepID=UPI00293D8A3F